MDVVGLEWMAIRNRWRRIIADEREAALFEPRREGIKPDLRDHEAFRSFLDDALETAQGTVAAIRRCEHAKRPKAKVCKQCPWKAVCRPDVRDVE